MCKGRGRGREGVEDGRVGGSTVFSEYSIYWMEIYIQTFKVMNLAENLQKLYQSDGVYTAGGTI